MTLVAQGGGITNILGSTFDATVNLTNSTISGNYTAYWGGKYKPLAAASPIRAVPAEPR